MRKKKKNLDNHAIEKNKNEATIEKEVTIKEKMEEENEIKEDNSIEKSEDNISKEIMPEDMAKSKDTKPEEGFLDDEDSKPEEGFLDDEDEPEEGFLDDDNDDELEKESEQKDLSDDQKEKTSEELEEDTTEGEKKKNKFLKPFLITIGSIFGLVLLVYLAGAIFFTSHFYYDTKINETNFSMKSEADVEAYFKSQVEGYSLTLLENDGTKEIINGTDISLVYKSNGQVKKLLKKQNPFLWPKAFWKSNSSDATISVSYDEQALSKLVSELETMKEEKQTPPANAYPGFNETTQKYEIVPEVYGTQINKEGFMEAIKLFISGFKPELSMQDNNCYAEPRFVKDSPEVIAANDTMNNYLKGTVTYTIPDNTEAVDANRIATWLTLGENMEVNLNTDAIAQYVGELDTKYSTLGATRTITTPTGKVAEVSGGTYGWSVDEAAELETLLANVKSGAPTERELIYAQTGASRGANDWGNTYVEVDLSSQYMWYIVNGAVAFESAVVTGKPSNGNATPAGVYSVLERMRNKVLRGTRDANGVPEYETPVSYWIRVTWSGVGFHDATWQSSFGGSRYLTNGSHGCINMPYSGVSNLYELIQVGNPVIMHY